MLRLLLMLSPLIGMTGCPTPVCSPNETRCSEDQTLAETCSADGEWLTVLDCANDIGEDGWICCPTNRGATCLPLEDETCRPR